MEKKLNHIVIAEPIVTPSILKKLQSVLISRSWTQGSYVEGLEKEAAKVAGTKYAVVVSSGTAALHTLLASLDLEKDDEIITTPFTFVATTNAILINGATPVFADVSEKDFCIDPNDVEKRITEKTKAIIAVDLYGQLANYTKLLSIARKHKILLLSDSSQAIGALHDNRPVGAYTHAATFSLYATKNVAAGEGGVIVTNSEKITAFARSFRNQGLSNGIPKNIGLNYRMTDILAVIALEQIKILPQIIKKRQNIANFYTKALSNTKGIILPNIHNENGSVFHQYTIRVKSNGALQRGLVIDTLSKNNISAGIYYKYPLHLVDQNVHLGYKRGDFPVSEMMAQDVLSLPIHYSLKKIEQQKVVDILQEIFT